MSLHLGKYAPWAWAIEPVRGCNLRCGHCTTRLWPRGEYTFINYTTWCSLFRIINEVKPKSRAEMAQAGEPTLHPELPRFVAAARKIAPHAQIQVTTNGTQLIKGNVSYKELFSAGLNIVYVDMYAPREQHIELAKKSGYYFYEYYNKPEDAPGAWKYHDDPRIKFIVLMTPPVKWPRKRKIAQRLGTFCNHLDWAAAEKYDLYPVTEAPSRNCSQLMKYVALNVYGQYLQCCQDFENESAVVINKSVADGTAGFLQFWFGRHMQQVRREVYARDRTKNPWCSTCQVLHAKCDFKLWPASALNQYWDGKQWLPM